MANVQTANAKESRLQIRLPAEDKALIEEAALQVGQTPSQFAATTLVNAALAILGQQPETRLSARDTATLLRLLDDETLEPNEALKDAARRYRELFK